VRAEGSSAARGRHQRLAGGAVEGKSADTVTVHHTFLSLTYDRPIAFSKASVI